MPVDPQGLAAAPAQQKIVIDVAERDAARTLAGALSDLLMPAPDALTLFERGTAWRIEAYYDPMPDATKLASDLELTCGIGRPEIRVEVVPQENSPPSREPRGSQAEARAVSTIETVVITLISHTESVVRSARWFRSAG